MDRRVSIISGSGHQAARRTSEIVCNPGTVDEQRIDLFDKQHRDISKVLSELSWTCKEKLRKVSMIRSGRGSLDLGHFEYSIADLIKDKGLLISEMTLDKQSEPESKPPQTDTSTDLLTGKSSQFASVLKKIAPEIPGGWDRLRKYTFTPDVEDMLGDVPVMIASLLHKIDVNSEDLKKATEDGNMSLAEGFALKRVTLHEDLLETVSEALTDLRSLTSRHSENVISLSEDKDDLTAITSEDHGTNSILEKAHADQEALARHSYTLETRLQSINEKLSSLNELLSEEMDENNGETLRQWKIIDTAIQALGKLEADRYSLSKRREAEIALTTKQKMLISVMQRATDEHTESLQFFESKIATQVAQQNSKQTALMESLGMLEEAVADMGSILKDKETRFHTAKVDAVSRLMQLLSKLVSKKDRKIQLLNEKLHSASIQLELCSETLNPEGKRHSDDRAAVLNLVQQTKLEQSVLRRKIHTAYQQLAPATQYLTEEGIPFTNPLDDIGDDILNRKAVTNDYHQHLADVAAEMRP